MNKTDLITFDGGGCNFYANGFDCRDCPFAADCDDWQNFDDTDTATADELPNAADIVPPPLGKLPYIDD